LLDPPRHVLVPQGTASKHCLDRTMTNNQQGPPHAKLTNRTPDTAGRSWRLLATLLRSQPTCSRVEACSTVENPPAALDLPPPAVSRAPCSRFHIPAVIGGPRHPSTWFGRDRVHRDAPEFPTSTLSRYASATTRGRVMAESAEGMQTEKAISHIKR
jgi:hypothetical protein